MKTERAVSGDVTFPTKVDAWLVAVLIVSLGGAIIASVFAAEAAEPGTWIALATMLGSILLIVFVSVPTDYTLSDTHLLIRFGRFRRSIPLSAILRVHRTRNPLSSPAWSLDRIAIHYREDGRRGYALISPVRGDEFLKLLERRAHLHEGPRGLVPIERCD